MRLLSLLALVVILLCPAFAEDLTVLAEKLVDSLEIADFAGGVKTFDGTMAKALPEIKLKEAWGAVILKMGKLKLRGMDCIKKVQGYDVVFVKCQFEKGALDVKVVFNDRKQVSGLFFLPPQPRGEAPPPAYAISERYREIPVEIGTFPWKLPGILTVPVGSGSYPGVVLVHGSGPNDRDETVGPNKPFRDIALGLATKGIAVLRYDKRTLTWKNKVIEQSAGFTVKEEVIDDVVEAVKFLQNTSEINRKKIFVLGHSLGGMLIPRIDSAIPNAAGFIILAGATRPIEEMMIVQTTYIASLEGAPSEEAMKEIADLKAKAGQIKNLKPTQKMASSPWIIGALPGYWLDLKEYNPTAAIKTVSKPLLFLQGERDYQVTMKDLDNWKKALTPGSGARFIIYPALNHLFFKGEGPSTPEEYGKPGNVSEVVIKDIAEFIFKPRN